MKRLNLLPALNDLRHFLGQDRTSLLNEVIETYQEDAIQGELKPERLRGFAQALYAAGLLQIEDFDDIDVAIWKACEAAA
ncbi:hypothetical protein [Stutzerimonas stutzeri]|uniref:Uncharacterized protein n=1 Tax=Stutzerimonas stutzeri TaxID=316 RepID=A0A0D7E0Z6_STUST|nr:hypothetical protein [Stutzerimonas stutzeri]KIZ34504.1 hypothetical protein LO50_17100 [Stutzerimonas stutzeri]